MASPQLENGFAMIASELVAAIFIADFPKYEKVVLADILLSLYGPQKLKAATIDHIRLAGMIGVDPRITRRAVAALIKRGVIKERANGTFTFVKDWESWTNPRDRDQADDPLCHLIGSGERRFIAYSTDRFSPPDESTDKRKRGTRQSPKSGCRGTIQSPNNPTQGTRWSPVNSDASSAAPGDANDLGISSSFEAVPPDPQIHTRIPEKKESYTDSSREGGELEPFMSPPVEPRALPPRSPDAQAIYAYVVRVTTSDEYPAGRDDMGEHVAREFETWVSANYSVAVVKSAIHKTLKKGGRILGNALNFSSYLEAVLTNHASGVADRPAAPPVVPPSQTRAMTYHKAPPRPKPTPASPEGAR